MNIGDYLARTRTLSSLDHPIEGCMSVMTSRGCPYRCVYCSSAAIWQKHRFFSARYVVEEIRDLLRRYSFDTVMICDDLFAVNKRRLREIVSLLLAEGIEQDVKFWVSGRANLFDEETATLLKTMNVFHVAFGFESGSEKVLRYLKKGSVTVEQNRNAALLAKQYGFRVEAGIILGAPVETKQDMEETYRFLIDAPIDAFGVQILTPLPGSELWEYAKGRNLVADTMEPGSLFDFDAVQALHHPERVLLLNEQMSRDEFFAEYRRFVQLWLERGDYHGRLGIGQFMSPKFIRTALDRPWLARDLLRKYFVSQTMIKRPWLYRTLKSLRRPLG